MNIVPVSSESVSKAIAECDALGRDRFLEKHGFGPSSVYELVVGDMIYDPKAIYAVAYSHDHPDSAAPTSGDLSSSPRLRQALTSAGCEIRFKIGAADRTIASLLSEFLGKYRPSTMGQFSGSHPVARLWKDEIRGWFATCGPVARFPQMKVKASYGQGNWAGVPWIAFLDPRETSSTQRGIYAVLLVKEDSSGFYLTAAQGVTEYKKTAKLTVAERDRRMQEVARRVRSWGTDEVVGAGFSLSPQPFLGDGQLARGYSASVIAHKYFPADGSLDSEDFLDSLDAVLRFVDQDIERRAAGESPSHLSDALFDASSAEAPRVSLKELVESFDSSARESGMFFVDEVLSRPAALLTALVTKPFVVLAGMSGSGKTQLALRLGEWFGRNRHDEARSLVVAVRPDWTGPESLFGYEDALRTPRGGRAAWFVPPTLDFLLRAAREPDMPYLLVLDEMNLAHVERYFSDYLSGIESGEPVVPNLRRDDDGEWRVSSEGPAQFPLPKNVMVVGTVNVDETTYQFSPKVIDRSTTFEVRTATDELTTDVRKPRPIEPAPERFLAALVDLLRDDSWHSRGASREVLADRLRALHADLTVSGHEFGHRVFYECLAWGAALEFGVHIDETAVLDELVLHKVLPRVQGARRAIEPVLARLQAAATAQEPGTPGGNGPAASVHLPKSRRKIERMLASAQQQHFVSYLE